MKIDIQTTASQPMTADQINNIAQFILSRKERRDRRRRVTPPSARGRPPSEERHLGALPTIINPLITLNTYDNKDYQRH